MLRRIDELLAEKTPCQALHAGKDIAHGLVSAAGDDAGRLSIRRAGDRECCASCRAGVHTAKPGDRFAKIALHIIS